MDGLGHVVDVLAVEAHHGDAAVFEHVDVVDVDQMQRLRFGEAGVGEHADLVGYVLPTPGSIQLFQFGPQALPHADHPICNVFQFLRPLLEMGLVVEDSISNSRPAEGRRGVLGPDHHFDLA